MPVAWNEDDPRAAGTLERNLVQVLRGVAQDAPLRLLPSVPMAQEWHRQIYRDVPLPVPYYAGEIRDSDPKFPELYGYEVGIGPHLGVPSRLVPEQLKEFEETLQEAVGVLDAVLPAGGRPSDPQTRSIVSLCAHAHGEWIRIHPFANGNGRTARLWVNWCALRYGLPPFLRLKPRPAGTLYPAAAMRSMKGDHRAMVIFLESVLDSQLNAPRPS